MSKQRLYQQKKAREYLLHKDLYCMVAYMVRHSRCNREVVDKYKELSPEQKKEVADRYDEFSILPSMQSEGVYTQKETPSSPVEKIIIMLEDGGGITKDHVISYLLEAERQINAVDSALLHVKEKYREDVLNSVYGDVEILYCKSCEKDKYDKEKRDELNKEKQKFIFYVAKYLDLCIDTWG